MSAEKVIEPEVGATAESHCSSELHEIGHAVPPVRHEVHAVKRADTPRTRARRASVIAAQLTDRFVAGQLESRMRISSLPIDNKTPVLVL